MKSPAFPFYTSNFLGATFCWSLEERGLYITLLSLQWDQGGIPEIEFERLSSAMAQPSKERVKLKFELRPDGLLWNSRLEEIRDGQNKFRANRSESGKAGAKKRWHSHSTAIAQPMANTWLPSPSPLDSPSTATFSVEPNVNFPRTEESASQHAEFVGCTREFAVLVWNKAFARGGRDSKDIEIRNWRSYLKVEAEYERERKAKGDYANNGTTRGKSVDRNAGTANSKTIGQYDGMGKVP